MSELTSAGNVTSELHAEFAANVSLFNSAIVKYNLNCIIIATLILWLGLGSTMVRSVILARIHDGLPLAASMDDDQVTMDAPM